MTRSEAAKKASDAARAALVARGVVFMTKEQTKERNRLSYVWFAMKKRCSDPSDPAYFNYGGRGIRVCERWLKSSTPFVDDMGPRPPGGMIERIDNNGNYEPSNCRWATRKEQNGNRRNCIYVVVNGETVNLAEACRRVGISYRPVVKRIIYRNWSIERALSTPIGKGNSHASY